MGFPSPGLAEPLLRRGRCWLLLGRGLRLRLLGLPRGPGPAPPLRHGPRSGPPVVHSGHGVLLVGLAGLGCWQQFLHRPQGRALAPGPSPRPSTIACRGLPTSRITCWSWAYAGLTSCRWPLAARRCWIPSKRRKASSQIPHWWKQPSNGRQPRGGITAWTESLLGSVARRQVLQPVRRKGWRHFWTLLFAEL